jgi:hypothetical protein
LYVKPFPKVTCIASILLSEVVLIALYNGWMSDAWLLGFDAAIVLLALQGLVIGSAILKTTKNSYNDWNES